MKTMKYFTLLLVTMILLSALTLAQNPNGDPIGPGDEVHDQRAGSMLIYNYYTSTWPGASDTRLTISNTHETAGVNVKLYFVAGNNGHVVPGSITLAPTQTQSFLASDSDPNTTGYIIAMAVNDQGIPIQWDFLMGTAAISLASGHQATLGALAVPINANNSYAALPRQLALDQLHSPADGIKQMLVINRIDGSLYSGMMPAIGTLNFDIFNQAGGRFSFTSRSLGPQARAYFYNLISLLHQSRALANFLPAGQYGWLRLRPTEAGAITGAVLYFRETAKTTVPYPGSHNLRHLTKTQAILVTSDGSEGTLEFGK